MKNILLYGDSNTWGFDPSTCGRYPYSMRWTTICAELLGKDFNCIPAGMNGRTTGFDDPLKGCRNGISGLDYELQSHKPLDLIVIMLGTNDLKYTDAAGSAERMSALVKQVYSANDRFGQSYPVFPDKCRVLLVSPVLITGSVNDNAACNEAEQSGRLAALYRKIAEEYHSRFLDASQITDPSVTDGVHLSPGGHRAIAAALAQEIRDIVTDTKLN